MGNSQTSAEKKKITGLNIYVIEQERVNMYGLNTQSKNLEKEDRINLSKGEVGICKDQSRS